MVRTRVALLGLLLLWAPSTFGQTVLNFPRVISSNDVITGLAVTNPTSSEASISFTAFDPSGNPPTGTNVQNPVTAKIPPGGQFSKAAAELFNLPNFNGWVQATSSTSGLAGFFINSNPAGTDQDGAGAVEAASELMLPLVASDTDGVTEITLVNVNAEPAAMVLTLYSSRGTAIATKDVSLPGRQVLRQTAKTIFGDQDFTAASHIGIKSDRPVVGHELVADFKVPGVSIRRETIQIAARQPNTSTVSVLPQFLTGAGWFSLLTLVNGSGLGQELTVTAFRDDGKPWDAPNNPKRLSLEGNASIRTTVDQLFGFGSDQLTTGWIEVRSSLGFLTSIIGFGSTQTPSFTLVPGIDSSRHARLNIFPHLAEGSAFYTGLSLVNPNKEEATVEMFILKPDGGTLGNTNFKIGGGQRAGKLFRDAIPAVHSLGGWLCVRRNIEWSCVFQCACAGRGFGFRSTGANHLCHHGRGCGHKWRRYCGCLDGLDGPCHGGEDYGLERTVRVLATAPGRL
jgi:hypothetical protein